MRRPGSSLYDAVGLQDFTTDEHYYERGISRLHGFLTERYVEEARFLVPVPDVLERVGHLLEPIRVVEKAIAQAFEIQRRVKVWEPARAAVLGSGPLGLLAVLALRLRRMDVTCLSLRRPPYLNSELVERVGARYLSTDQVSVAEAAAAHGPFDLILEGTGYSPLIFESAEALARNGVLVLLSITGGDRAATVNSDAINQGFALGNKVMVGSVNAAYEDFISGVDDLLEGHAVWPGWLEALLTNPISGLGEHERLMTRAHRRPRRDQGLRRDRGPGARRARSDRPDLEVRVLLLVGIAEHGVAVPGRFLVDVRGVAEHRLGRVLIVVAGVLDEVTLGELESL